VKLAAVTVLLAALLMPAAAAAYPEPASLAGGPHFPRRCPPRPADSVKGTDPQTAALVVVAQELADQCTLSMANLSLSAAASQKAAAVLARDSGPQAMRRALSAAVAPVVLRVARTGAAQAGALRSVAGQVHRLDITPPPTDDGSGPTQVVALDQNDTDLIASASDSLHGDVYVLIGCVIACFAGQEILRRVLP
jgi:hypothetical protein